MLYQSKSNIILKKTYISKSKHKTRGTDNRIQTVNEKEIGLSCMCILNIANEESLRLHKSMNYQTQTDLCKLINSERSHLLIHHKKKTKKIENK